VKRQKAIYQAVKGDKRLKNVIVVGPSLNAAKATEAQYKELRDLGLPQWMDYSGVHSYPNGHYPDNGLGQRLRWAAKYWKKPVWVTETGYTNALHRPKGHNPVPNDVSAVYAPSALLEAVDRGCKSTWYELLDDPDSLAKTQIESNFGMFSTAYKDQPPWPPKPIFATMRSFLALLKDPGPAYTPAAIPLKITPGSPDVRVTVTANRNGVAMAHIRRAIDYYNPDTQQYVVLPPTTCKLEGPTGTKMITLPATSAVVSVPLSGVV
jgi:hypothetical protein